jgi:hypothetical protein
VRRHRRRTHPQLHLPPLNGHEALLLVAICERLIAAVWRAHGEAMGDILIEPLANRLPPQRSPHALVTPPPAGSPTSDDDELF